MKEIILNSLRWPTSMLTEAVSSFGEEMPDEARDNIRKALTCLRAAEDIIRFGKRTDGNDDLELQIRSLISSLTEPIQEYLSS